jgi:RND family efflux transporter MFP subunit
LNRDSSHTDVPDNGRHELDPGDRPAPGDGRISTDAAPRTARVLTFVVGGLVVVLAIGFGVAFAAHWHTEAAADHAAGDARDAKDAVNVVSVHGTPGQYPLTLPGQTAGWYQSTIFARVDGYVSTWSADIGDRVKQGQVLATIDTPELDQQLNAAKAKAEASDAQVEVAQSNASIAKLTYDRWRDSPKGVVSEQEREEKKAMYTAAAAHLTEARAQAQLDRADVGRYEALVTFRNVTAPYDGVITARHVDIGDLVTLGSSASTSPLYGLAQSNVMRVFVDVPQKAAAGMTVGLAAHASSDQYPSRLFSGTVARTAMSIDPQTRTERVEVDVPNADLTLVPGMYLQVTFELNQHGLLQVPAAAILYRPDGLKVAVVLPDGRVQIRPVTIAKDDGEVVELASGVDVGDKVALNISSAITPGQQVTAVDDEQDQPTSPAPAAVAAPVEQLPPPPAGVTPSDRLPAPDSGTHPPAPAKAPATGR